ncbi:MAG: right-handed parallel beta-helix repeat-containing protein, partial [Ignavibacteriaceae bacterium]
MKFRYFLILVALLIGTVAQIYAQHEMVVEWDDGSGNIVQDALYNAVMGDTASDGTRADLDRVYVLKKGGYYWNNQTIANTFPLRLVGEEPGATHEEHPAVVQMVTDIVDGSLPGKMISCSSDLTLKNLYIIGSDELGSSGYYQPIEVNAVGKRFIIDNCVFERSDFAIVAFAGGSDNDVFITNCKYRNLIEGTPTQQWTGRGLSIWTDADTVVIENNTFFNVNMCAIQIENGAANYLRFNHNTLVNIGRAIHSTTNDWWREAYFSNLLLVNVFWHGEGACDYRADFSPNRQDYYTGLFNVINMPSRYGTNIGRRILFSNTAAYLDSYFKTRYADTVRVEPYANERTKSFFTTYSPSNGGQMLIQDTSWLSANPSFDNDPNTTAQLEAMYNHITASRGYQYYGTGVQALPYYYALQVDGADTLWAEPDWPLTENFHYSDNLTGTDGLPLGDLNWFPSSKTDFENNKDAYVNQIENMPGGRVIEDVAFEAQAEDGTLGGDAVVDPFTGNAWYTLVGGSNVQWTFNSTYAGPYDIKFVARADGQNIGFDFLVNDEHVVDALHGWGQFVVWTDGDNGGVDFWSDKSTTEFYEAAYTNAMLKNNDNDGNLSVISGENTLKLQYSWNDISFQWVEFYEAGTENLIARLIPADAVNTGATPSGEGVWVPLGFNSVNMGSNGSVQFNVNLTDPGTYKVRAFFQNPGSEQSGNIKLDGNNAALITYSSEPDSTGLDVITALFDATEGAHTLTITGS